ncbi:MAG: MFS transporter [Bifidobacteriaceae bacterium]|jgi:ACS family hexuronate transporter-like MFS transporter|nr:MFS transporter [Bifidobacteriaceae bacterium]
MKINNVAFRLIKIKITKYLCKDYADFTPIDNSHIYHFIMIAKKQKQIFVLLFLCNMLQFMNLTALAVAKTDIQSTLNISDALMGIILSAATWGLAPFNIIGGIAADKFGPKKVLLIACVCWSLATGAICLASTFIGLLIVQICFGISQGPLGVGTNKTIDLWFAPRKKSTIMGFICAGTPLGAALIFPVVSYFSNNSKWEYAFLFIMILGLVWAVIWSIIVPKKSPKPDDIKYLFDYQAASNKIYQKTKNPPTIYKYVDIKIKQNVRLKYYLTQKTIIFSSIAFFSYNYILFFFLTWYPSYMQSPVEKGGLGISPHIAMMVQFIPWILGFIALALGGKIADHFTIRLQDKSDRLKAKKNIIGFGLIISGVSVIIASKADSNNIQLAIIMISIVVASLYLTGGLFWGIINDVVNSNSSGVVGGIMHATGNTAGIFAPIITGFIVQATSNYGNAFLIAGCIGILGGGSALIFIRQLNTVKIEKYIKN